MPYSKEKNFKIEVNGSLNPHITSKDLILHIIGKIGTAGGTGHVIEYSGPTILNLSMEGRMTVSYTHLTLPTKRIV